MTHRNVPDAVRKNRIITAAHWRALGLSEPQLRALRRSGDLVRIRRGVYASKTAVRWAEGNDRRIHVLHAHAARATIGRHAVASHRSAAVIHGLDLLDSPPADHVSLTLPPARRWTRAQSAKIVFHIADLPEEHRVKLYNLPVTSVARTVIDLARTLSFLGAVVTADSALHAEKTTKPELLQVIAKCARWPGVRQARRVVEFADERAESPLESAARVVFAEFGLDPPELQAPVFTPSAAYRVDFCWLERKVVAEADGLAKYRGRDDYLRQLERDRHLQDAGYQVVHFTWQELFATPVTVIERIRRAVANRPVSESSQEIT